MLNILKASAAIATIAMLAACSGNDGGNVVLHPGPTASPTLTPVTGATKYIQIERLSRPAVKEVFEPFQDHQTSNAIEPYADTTIQGDIKATEDALRPPNTSMNTDYGNTLSGLLYPDEYVVNLAGSAPSGADPYYFLSYEVSGGTAFGGRAPNDDVIDLELGALFGSTLHAIGVVPNEDGEENNCLSSQNIGGQGQFTEDSSKKTTSTFPYLPTPH